jgi:hypothetical protein
MGTLRSAFLYDRHTVEHFLHQVCKRNDFHSCGTEIMTCAIGLHWPGLRGCRNCTALSQVAFILANHLIPEQIDVLLEAE